VADRPVGLLAEFATEDALIGAVAETVRAGYRRVETFSPYPIQEIAKLLRIRSHAIGWLSLAGGLFGFFGALAVEVLTSLNYPINVGGRPLLAWPAFIVIDFELMILFSVLFPVVGMLYLNGLPRLHHPLFGTPRFGLATDDRFFLYIDASDSKFDAKATRAFLKPLGPAIIEEVLD
jgi:hypothetical protein